MICLFLTSSPLKAHDGSEIYFIVAHSEQPPLIDGEFSEWNLDNRSNNTDHILDSSELWTIKNTVFDDVFGDPLVLEMKWSSASNKIYVAAKGGPPPHNANGTLILPDSRNDSLLSPWNMSKNYLFALFFDLDHTGGNLFDQNAEPSIREQKYDFSTPLNNSITTPQAWVFNPWNREQPFLLVGMPDSWVARPPYSEVVVVYSDANTFYIEAGFAVWDSIDRRGPEHSHRYSLGGGNIWRFNVLLNWIYRLREDTLWQASLSTLSFPDIPLWETKAFPHLVLGAQENLQTGVLPYSWGQLKLIPLLPVKP